MSQLSQQGRVDAQLKKTGGAKSPPRQPSGAPAAGRGYGGNANQGPGGRGPQGSGRGGGRRFGGSGPGGRGPPNENRFQDQPSNNQQAAPAAPPPTDSHIDWPTVGGGKPGAAPKPAPPPAKPVVTAPGGSSAQANPPPAGGAAPAANGPPAKGAPLNYAKAARPQGVAAPAEKTPPAGGSASGGQPKREEKGGKEAANQTTPANGKDGGGSAPVLQFGSLPPQFPARTSSAPPSLEEQNRNRQHLEHLTGHQPQIPSKARFEPNAGKRSQPAPGHPQVFYPPHQTPANPLKSKLDSPLSPVLEPTGPPPSTPPQMQLSDLPSPATITPTGWGGGNTAPGGTFTSAPSSTIAFTSVAEPPRVSALANGSQSTPPPVVQAPHQYPPRGQGGVSQPGSHPPQQGRQQQGYPYGTQGTPAYGQSVMGQAHMTSPMPIQYGTQPLTPGKQTTPSLTLGPRVSKAIRIINPDTKEEVKLVENKEKKEGKPPVAPQQPPGGVQTAGQAVPQTRSSPPMQPQQAAPQQRQPPPLGFPQNHGQQPMFYPLQGYPAQQPPFYGARPTGPQQGVQTQGQGAPPFQFQQQPQHPAGMARPYLQHPGGIVSQQNKPPGNGPEVQGGPQMMGQMPMQQQGGQMMRPPGPPMQQPGPNGRPPPRQEDQHFIQGSPPNVMYGFPNQVPNFGDNPPPPSGAMVPNMSTIGFTGQNIRPQIGAPSGWGPRPPQMMNQQNRGMAPQGGGQVRMPTVQAPGGGEKQQQRQQEVRPVSSGQGSNKERKKRDKDQQRPLPTGGISSLTGAQQPRSSGPPQGLASPPGGPVLSQNKGGDAQGGATPPGGEKKVVTVTHPGVGVSPPTQGSHPVVAAPPHGSGASAGQSVQATGAPPPQEVKQASGAGGSGVEGSFRQGRPAQLGSQAQVRELTHQKSGKFREASPAGSSGRGVPSPRSRGGDSPRGRAGEKQPTQVFRPKVDQPNVAAAKIAAAAKESAPSEPEAKGDAVTGAGKGEAATKGGVESKAPAEGEGGPQKETFAQKAAKQAKAASAGGQAKPEAKVAPQTGGKMDGKAKGGDDGKAKAEKEKEERARADADARAKADAEGRTRADEKAKAEAEAKAKVEAEEKAEAERKVKEEREAAEREAKERAEREAKEKAERERAELEAKRKAEEEEKRIAEEEAKKKAEEEARRKAEEAEARRKAEEEKARLAAEAKAKEEAERKAKLEAEKKAEAERKAKLEAERKAREKLEAEQRAEAERKKKEEERIRVEKEQEEKKRKEEEELRKAEEKKRAEEKAKAEAEAKKLEAERKAKAEAEAKKLEAERRAKAEAEAKAKAEEKARKEKEEVERKRAEEERTRAQEEREKQEEEERKRAEAAKAESEAVKKLESKPVPDGAKIAGPVAVAVAGAAVAAGAVAAVTGPSKGPFEKGPSDNAPIENAPSDKDASDKTLSGQTLPEEAPSEKSVAEKTASETLASEAPASDKALSEKTPSERPTSPLKEVESAASKKKKRKEALSKADAAGDSKNLLDAFTTKKPDEAPKPSTAFETPKKGGAEKHAVSKVEVDDWEEAADAPTPKPARGGVVSQRPSTPADKKYTRDYVMTFKEDNRAWPAELLLTGAFQVLFVQADMPKPRTPTGKRGAKGGPPEDDKWLQRGPSGPADARIDSPNRGGPLPGNFRPGGPGPSLGRGMRSGPPGGPGGRGPGGQFVPPGVSPALLGMPPGGGLGQNGIDANRWGKKPMEPVAPKQPLPAIHKTQNRFVVGTPTDEETAKIKKVKGILNKLTPENFGKLFQQMIDVEINNATTLTMVIAQVFEKALLEPGFCELYAEFSKELQTELPEFMEKDEEGNEVKVTFRRILLNKCQEEFERSNEQVDENSEEKAEEEGEEAEGKEREPPKKLTAAQIEEENKKIRQRFLGNVRFIGELYKKGLLTEKIMHVCITKLLGGELIPHEEDLEALCKLMTTIGAMIDHQKSKAHMDAYLSRMKQLSKETSLSSRIRFGLLDVVEMRDSGWRERRKKDGPKTIDQVHRDAAQESRDRLAAASARPDMRRGGPGGGSGRRDFAPPAQMRGGPGPIFPNPPQMRGGPQMGRGPGDARLADRMDGPIRGLSARHDDGQLVLGPGGRPRPGFGPPISNRGEPMPPDDRFRDNRQMRDRDGRPIDPRAGPPPGDRFGDRGGPGPDRFADRGAGGRDGFGGGHGRGEFERGPTRDFDRRERDEGPSQDRSPLLHGPPDRGPPSRPSSASNDRSASTDRDSTSRLGVAPREASTSRPATPQSPAGAGKVSEEELEKRTVGALKEYIGLQDVKEVEAILESLDSAWYHPRMIALWVQNAIEGKDNARASLAKLVPALAQGDKKLLSREHIEGGFKIFLDSLEDIVIDVPLAYSHTAALLSTLVTAHLISLSTVGNLLKHGGFEEGDLVSDGGALKVLMGLLKRMKDEPGEEAMVESFKGSGLQLKDFAGEGMDSSGLDHLLRDNGLTVLVG